MTWATCKCGTGFYRDDEETWKVLCVPCWKKSKGTTTTTYRRGSRDASATRLRAELAEWMRRALVAEARLQAPSPKAFDLATLKRMRLLCHPDKHGNSEAANQVTQLLNDAIRQSENRQDESLRF